jgi:DNA-binding Lrp family transcriptional regulator
MNAVEVDEVYPLDELDRKIIQALQIDPRAAFAGIGEVLGVSEQTVARRYRRLHGDGVLRIVGLVSPRHMGVSEWVVRVTCRPGGTGPLAEALARRDDVSWVALSAGGSEIVCSVRPRSDRQRDNLLLQRLPATSQVLSMSAHAILHRFVGGASTDWTGYGRLLTGDQAAALAAAAGPQAVPEPGPARADVRLAPEDEPMLAELGRDGRCSYKVLAAGCGWTQGRVTRRLDALRRAGVVYLDLDLATDLIGFRASAYLWLSVRPAALTALGTELAGHPEVAYAAAVTGGANLLVAVLCPDLAGLYRYVTTRISAAAGVAQLEISPILRRTKQAGSMMDGPRLAPPGVRPGPSSRRAAAPGGRG